MARGLVLLVVALCATTAFASKTTLPMTTDSIAAVFKGFSDELQATLGPAETHGRNLLSFKDDTHEFFKDILGKNWTSFVPASWKQDGSLLDKLLHFDIKSGLSDFLDSDTVAEFSRPHSLEELHDLFEDALSSFCTNWTFVPPAKVDPFCTGPTVSLTYNPKICIIDETKKQIICTPSSITLTKTPGLCVKKLIAPAVFTGHSCKISKTIGIATEVVIGGDEFVVPLNKYFPLSDSKGEKLEAKFEKKLKKFHKWKPIEPSPEPEVEPEVEPVPEPSPEPEVEPSSPPPPAGRR